MSHEFASLPGDVAISAGAQAAAAGTIVFSNANGVSFGMNLSTVTASVAPAAPTLRAFAVATNINTLSSAGGSGSTLSVYRVQIPFALTATMAQVMLAPLSTDSSGTYSIVFGVYTMAGSTASLVTSASRTQAYTANEGNHVLPNWKTIGDTTFNFSAGDYLFAVAALQSNGAGQSNPEIGYFTHLRPIGGDGASTQSTFGYWGSGVISTNSAYTTLPNTLQLSNLTQNVTTFQAMNYPVVRLFGTN